MAIAVSAMLLRINPVPKFHPRISPLIRESMPFPPKKTPSLSLTHSLLHTIIPPLHIRLDAIAHRTQRPALLTPRGPILAVVELERADEALEQLVHVLLAAALVVVDDELELAAQLAEGLAGAAEVVLEMGLRAC